MSDPSHHHGAALWRCLLGDTAAVAPVPAALIDAAMRVVPAPLLAHSLAAPQGETIGHDVRQIVDLGRYVFTRQLEVLRWLAEAGIATVAMKGFAAALVDWPEPGQRVVGDLDLLLRRADLARAIDVLGRRGFRFGGALKTRWGFLPDASFVPFFSADRLCNVDLHIEPDSYPLHLGLDADAVFAQANSLAHGGVAIAVPRGEHALLIAVSNLAKDKFPLSGARKLIDIARLLRRAAPLDWNEIEHRALRARLAPALHAILSLFVALGGDRNAVPARWSAPPAGLRGMAWRGVLRRWRGFDAAPVPLLGQLQREWLLAATPGVAAHLALRRLRGWWRPRSGIPASVPGASAALADGSTGRAN